MSAIILISIAVRALALGWAVHLALRFKDRRLWLFVVALAGLALEQVFVGFGGRPSAWLGQVGIRADVLCLTISLILLGSVFCLGRILHEMRARFDQAAHSEARFRDLVEASSDRYWEMDRDLRYVWARESTEKQRAPFVQELIGKTRWEVYEGDPDHDERWRQHRDDLNNRRPFRDLRHPLTGRDGVTRHWSVSGKPVYAADGSFAGYRGTATDITLQVELQEEAEQALRRSEQRLRDFAYAASDWFWETDADLRFTFVSQRTETAARLQAPGMIGKDPGDLDLTETDAGVLKRHLEHLGKHKEIRNFVYSIRQRNGSLRHFRVSGRPLFDEASTFLGYRGVGTDITAEVVAERQRQQAEVRLAKSIEAIPAGFALFDEADRLVICNKEYRGCYEALGVDVRPGIRFDQLVWAAVDNASIGSSQEDAELWARQRLIRRTCPAEGFEFRHNGSRWSEVSDYLLPDGGMITLAYDITDRKLTEEALRVSEQHFRNVVEGSEQGMFIYKGDEFIFANQAYADMLGYTPEEIYALDPPQLAYAPYERERIRQYSDARIRGETAPTSYEVDALRKDGSIITLHHFAKRAEWYGEPVSQVAVVDITDRKRTEEELRESQTKLAKSQQRLLDAIESLNDGFVLHDAEDQMVLSNSKFNDFYELSPELLKHKTLFSDQIRWALANGKLGDARGREEDWLQERISLHRDPKGAFEQRLSDGRWLQVNEIRTKEGGIVGIRTDITRLKQAEEAIRQHEADLAMVQRRSTMGEMAAALAHELNQPLTAVVNYCAGSLRRLEADSMSQDELVEILTTIREQAQRAGDVLRHIGSFVSEGEVSKGLVDINDAIRSVMALLKEELRRNRIEVRLQLSADLPEIHAAEIGIEQVVLNVVKNAIEAMQGVDAAERRLRISTSRRAGGRVMVSVTDSGHGFSATNGETYFEPFVSTKKDGMGMGLAICRSIISALGGRISMRKGRKAGTKVSFLLPSADEAMQDAA